MATTTIRLEDDLNARVAEQAGKTASASKVDAIGEAVERGDAFHAIADERWAKIRGSEGSVSLEAAKPWLEARSHGATPPRPAARKVKG